MKPLLYPFFNKQNAEAFRDVLIKQGVPTGLITLRGSCGHDVAVDAVHQLQADSAYRDYLMSDKTRDETPK